MDYMEGKYFPQTQTREVDMGPAKPGMTLELDDNKPVW